MSHETERPDGTQASGFQHDVSDATSLRIQYEAMQAWLREITFRGQAAQVVYSEQSRFFAQENSLWKNIPAEKPQNLDRQAVPLPLVSLLASSVDPDPTRFTKNKWTVLGPGPQSTSTRCYAKDDKSEIWELPFPIPVDVGFQVEVWTKTGQDMLLLRTELIARLASVFPGENFIKATFPFYGEKLLPVVWERDDDNSDLEGDRERILRHTFSLTLKGWIFRRPIRKKTINKAHIAVIEGDHTDENVSDWYCDLDHYNFSTDGSQLLSIDENPAITPPDRVLLTLSFGSDGNLTNVGP